MRTSEGLRSTLFDTLDAFLTGAIDAETARTTTKIASTILKSVAIDIEHKKLVHQMTQLEGPQAVADLNLNLRLAAPKDE